MGHYRGTKCTYDGIDFDSIPEKEYYIKLVNDDSISELSIHPKFILLEGFKNYENKSIRSLTFKPDFMYIKDGFKWVVDIKPIKKSLIDDSFFIRWKLLQHMYKEQNIKFRLIAYDKKSKEFVEI